MGEDFRARIGLAHLGDVGGGEALVHFAAALPGDDADARLPGDIAGEELVGEQDHPIDAPLGRHGLHHLDGVGAGAADVGLRLHRGGGVDVGDHRQARVTLLDQPHVFRGDRGGQRAAGEEVGDEHRLFRRKHLGGLRHEMDAGLHNNAGVAARRLPGERQAVADKVADAVEYLRSHVVVSQDDRVLFALQPVDLFDQRGLEPPLHRRDMIADLAPQRAGGLFHLRREREAEGTISHLNTLLLNMSISRAEDESRTEWRGASSQGLC